MPHRLKQRQAKIQEKRKKTPWRKFVMEIAGWIPLVFYKHDRGISRYPITDRLKNLVSPLVFEELKLGFSQGAKDYDHTKTFFEQFTDMYRSLPHPIRLIGPQVENAEYADAVWESHNVYLSFIIIDDCENIGYSFYIQNDVKNTRSSMMVWDHCETIYQSIAVLKSYKIFYSRYITNCANVWFSTNLIGCQECILCNNLENKSYCIRNQQYSEEGYFQEKKALLQQKELYEDWFAGLSLKSYNYNSERVDGVFCVHSHDVEQGRFVYRTEYGRNIMFVGHEQGRKNIYDCFGSDQVGEGNMYACSNMGSANHAYCCDACQINNSFYCQFCIQCSYCLGCVGLVNKSFCIFNKQYTKDERFDKVDEIFTQMEKEGILGDFFPGSMNPFYFNDTAAYLIDDSFTKEEVEAEGYMWRDEEIKVDIPEGMEVVNVKDLGKYEGWKQTPTPKGTPSPYQETPNAQSPLIRGGADEGGGGVGKQRWIDPEILKKVIRDENGNVYRIVKMEYEFLMKHGLPLPRLHWLERLKMNFTTS